MDKKWLSLAVLCLVFSSCRSISEEAKEEIAKPVDCSTAQQDIAILQSEKASVEKQILDGVTMATPAGLALTILSGELKDKGEIASGDYNELIANKIAKIKEECGIA
jgi:hypothetical protein